MEVLAEILRELPSGDILLDQIREDRAQGDCGCDVVYPVSDFDGDGRADIVEITIHEASNGSAESTIDVLSSRRGGDSLFTQPARVPGYAVALPTRLSQGPGLLYYSVDYRYVFQSYAGQLRAGVLTPSGSRMWERSWPLPWTWAPLWYMKWLEELAVLTDGNGNAVGIVIAISESVGPSRAVELHLEHVASANGETLAERTTIEDQVENVEITPIALRGKAKSALAVQVNPISGNKEALRIHPSLDEDPLWQLRVWEYAWVKGTLNLVGGPRRELVLEQGFGKRYVFQALDSRRGEVKWQSSVGGWITDDAGADGRSDVLQIRQLGHEKDRRWRLTRIELPGRVLWTEDVGVRHQYDDFAWTSIDVAPWGDVDEDGTAEVRVRMTTYTDGGDRLIYLGSERALLDGRSGRTMTQAARYIPLTGSLDGRGSDALTVRVAPDLIEITGRDSSDDSVLWSRRILIEEARPGMDPCLWGYYVVDGPSSDDVLVVVPRRGGGDEEILIDGATGNVIWHLDKASAP